MATCPKLTELTVISHYQRDTRYAEMGNLLNPAGRAPFAISELVVACKAFPDFGILQIVRIAAVPCYLMCSSLWERNVLIVRDLVSTPACYDQSQRYCKQYAI